MADSTVARGGKADMSSVRARATNNCAANNRAPSPGFVGVAANVDAPGELHLTGFGIFDVDIDVQDEVAHLLHGTPRGPVRADHLRELALAAVAVANCGSRCDLLDPVRRNVDDLKTARGRRGFSISGG
jgi:hypothetical protein